MVDFSITDILRVNRTVVIYLIACSQRKKTDFLKTYFTPINQYFDILSNDSYLLYSYMHI